MAPLTATQAREDTRVVEKIRVVVHTGHALDQSDNHWSIYLLLQDEGSVRVNMATEYEEIEGRLEWSNLQYLLTNSALHYWDYPAVQPIQVLHVARSIYDRNRHRYCFSGGGSGCRFWVRVVIYDLEDQGYIGSGTSNNLWGFLQYLYRPGKDPLQINWVEGEFY